MVSRLELVDDTASLQRRRVNLDSVGDLKFVYLYLQDLRLLVTLAMLFHIRFVDPTSKYPRGFYYVHTSVRNYASYRAKFVGRRSRNSTSRVIPPII
jgi:hypothetical protein